MTVKSAYTADFRSCHLFSYLKYRQVGIVLPCAFYKYHKRHIWTPDFSFTPLLSYFNIRSYHIRPGKILSATRSTFCDCGKSYRQRHLATAPIATAIRVKSDRNRSMSGRLVPTYLCWRLWSTPFVSSCLSESERNWPPSISRQHWRRYGICKHNKF